MQTDSKKHETPTDANNVLAAGFPREAKRFSKMYALLQILNSQVDAMNDAAAITTDFQSEWAYAELCRMNLPNGFDRLGSFDEALRWFLQTCR
jgi:hypothetical protein